MTIYNDYTRARVGWFFGLSGWQLGVVSLGTLPSFWSIREQSWGAALTLLGFWVLLACVVIVPVRGRSATGWLVAMIAFGLASLTGRSRFRGRAARGSAIPLENVDLPGALNGIEIHDAPPVGPSQSRIAIVQHHATRTWAVTASVTHPGIGMLAQ